MKDGFYPALGTPTSDNGELIEDSYNKEIELMLEAGAQGVLCMGSMGKMAAIRNSEYPKIAKYCFKVISERIPVMVGVMDCSASRVLDRIEALGNMNIDGVEIAIVSEDGASVYSASKSARDEFPNIAVEIAKSRTLAVSEW